MLGHPLHFLTFFGATFFLLNGCGTPADPQSLVAVFDAGGSSSTGGGSSPATCDKLVMDGAPISSDPSTPGWEQLWPRIVPIQNDGSQVGVTFLERPNGATKPYYATSIVMDNPWGTWPQNLGVSALHGANEGFVVGPGANGRFSMLTTDMPNNENVSKGMVVWFPNAGVAGAQGQFFDDLAHGYPLFVTHRAPEWLAGFHRKVTDELQHLGLARITSPVTSAAFDQAFACATYAGLSASAVPVADGFLVAMSNGRPFGHCLTDQFADGPPIHIQIVSLDKLGAVPVLRGEYTEADGYVFQVHTAKSVSGAWIAWEVIPFQSPFERRIRLMRLDATGTPTLAKPIHLDYGVVGVPFALTTLGDLPVLVMQGMTKNLGGLIDVRLLAENGDVLAAASIEADTGTTINASISTVGSPEGRHLLVAWDEDASNATPRRGRIARLACASQ